MSDFEWITVMRKTMNGNAEDKAARKVDRLEGQAAMKILDGDRVQIHTMPDAGCFDTAVIISREDALDLARIIIGRFG